jgi:hypothetical protein
MNVTSVCVCCCSKIPETFAAAFWFTNVTLPGSFFISATSSGRVFAARFFFATNNCGLFEISPTGSKSFSRS